MGMKKAVIGLVLGLLIGISGTAIAATNETVQAVFAKFKFIVNGEEKELEADPLVYQGSTYLPVRVVANLLGYDVTYKADSRTIELNSKQGVDDSMTNTVLTGEWISLRQLAANGIEVTVGPEHNVLTIRNGENKVQFLTTDIVEGQTAEIKLYGVNGTITVKSQNGQTYLRVDQLEARGILNQ